MKRHRIQRLATPISIIAWIAVSWLAAISPGEKAQGNAPADIQAILRKIDDLYRSRSSTAEITMTIVTPNWQRTLALRSWTLGQDRMFLRILSPLKEQGVGTLKIGSEMWNYFPKTDKVMKLPPSMMMSSWMGSDFTNDDVVKEYKLADDFTSRLIQPEKAEPGVIYIESRPKEGLPIIWDKTIAAVRETDLIPLWQEFFDERGTLVRSLRFGEVKKFGVRSVPSIMEMTPRTKVGYKTVVRFDKLAFDVPLSDEIFSLRNLQSQK